VDVHSVLKYLALVEPRPGELGPSPAPAEPGETDRIQIVLSARPEKMAALGWAEHQGSKILGPDALGEA
jgi:hypothetical protein